MRVRQWLSAPRGGAGRIRQYRLLLEVLLCLAVRSVSGAETTPPDKPAGDATFNPFDANLEEFKRLTVEAAAKVKQPVGMAPSSVTIITAEEVKLYGYRTLADVLQSVRGLYVTYDRNYSFLGTRGFNRGDANSRVLVLVDGHRINNNLSDGGFIGTEFLLDVDLIEQVEIIRGPAATLYGNNAFFGVINVTTRKGQGLPGYGAEASVEAAGFDTYKGRVTYGHLFKNGLEMLLSGSVYDSQGQERLFFREFDAPATHNGLAQNGDRDNYKSAFARLSWRDFTLQGAFITREKLNPTGQYGNSFNDPRHRTVDDRSYVDLGFAHGFPDVDVLEVKAKLYYDRYDFLRDQPSFDPTLPLNKEEQAGEWWGTEVQFNKRLFDKHTLTLGAEYRDDFRRERRNYDVNPYFEWAHVKRDTFNYGVFLESDIMLRTNLHLNAGGRYDQYGDNKPTANPRVALIYNPHPTSTLKAIYGSAFRAPNFFESTFNPDLKPETITTYELVYEQGIGRHLRATADLFYNQIDDLISLRPDPLGGSTYRNIKGAIASGMELELEAFWKSGFRGRASYAFQETEDRDTNQVLTDSPKHLLKFNLSAPVVKEKVFASLEWQYTSGRTTLLGTEAGGFGVMNFTLFSQNLVKGLDVSGSVYNLLDRHYNDPATPFHYNGLTGQIMDLIERDGRTFRLKLTYRF